jgi:cbb3-type cytochrome oxidase subunit 1
MVGWVTQMIFGVVYWMFPKYSMQEPHGNEKLALATFWLLNGGLVLRAVAEPANTLTPDTLWGWALAVSALLQWSAAISFVAITWRRVR